MMWNRLGRGTLASVLSLALVSVTACSRDYVLAYVYVTTAKPLTTSSQNGGVSAYAVDFQIGSLTPLADSPIAAGRNPVTLVATPNGLHLYVINHDDSSVGQYNIGTDGKIFLENTYNVTGSMATAAAIDPGGKFLYVTFTYQLGPGGQQLYSPSSPGPGGVTIFPINPESGANPGSLGTPLTQNVGNGPVGVVVSRVPPTGAPQSFVYVIDQETPTTPKAQVLGFVQNATTGALTPTPGTAITTDSTGKTVATGYGAGVTPSAIAIDPSARFVYITDQATNVVYGDVVSNNGSLVAMVGGPFPTGIFPVGVTVDPRGKFLYVANLTSSTVSAFAIDTASGAPVGSTGSAQTTVDTAPTCVTIEPALGLYTYTSNNLANTVSALKLDPHNGGLGSVQNTPFPAGGLPTCAVSVANGSHPSQIIVP
jgi:6-phosphogluconolactonase